MRVRAILFIFITGLVFSQRPSAEPRSFYQEWRSEQTRRLARLVPSERGRHLNPSGVSGLAIAKILGVSRVFVSQALNRPTMSFNYAHIVKLAQRLNVEPGYLLVERFFDRFATLDQFERAIRDERRGVRDLLTRIYMERGATHPPDPEDEVSFERRRRAVIKFRLSQLVPGTRGSLVSIIDLGRILGRSRPATSLMVNGPDHLRYQDADALGTRFGVTPEWILAADLLDRFSDREDFARAVGTEKPAVRLLLTTLWDARAQCPRRLTTTVKPSRATP